MRLSAYRSAGILVLLTCAANLPGISQIVYEPYAFTTLAGGPPFGSADGTNDAARFYNPQGVTADLAGNLYLTDTGNSIIRRVTPEGAVTTLAGFAGRSGSSDGTGSDARFNQPAGIALDAAGNLYVADAGNHTLRIVKPEGTNWVVTTLAGAAGNAGSADGVGTVARFNYPRSVTVDQAGNVYVADTTNNTIRIAAPVADSWVVTTLAGTPGKIGSSDGTASMALFNRPSGVAVDSSGNAYVVDTGNGTLRVVTPAGVVTTLAARPYVGGSDDGTGPDARFGSPCGVAVGGNGNVYIADTDNSTIRKVTPVGVVTTVAGNPGYPGSTDGIGPMARFNHPLGVTADVNGNIYVADSTANLLRKVTPEGAVTTLAGPTNFVQFNNYPGHVAVDNEGNVYLADNGNAMIRKVTPTGTITTPVNLRGSRNNSPQGIAVDRMGRLFVTDSTANTLLQLTSAGTNWTVTTIAGLVGATGTNDGVGNDARFNLPADVAVDNVGNLYVADQRNHTVRKVVPQGTNWMVTTLAGKAGSPGSLDGTGNSARFNFLQGLAVDSFGNVFVADLYNSTIRKVTTDGVVTTLAGKAGRYGKVDGVGSAARFEDPASVAVDFAGNLYVADEAGHRICKLSPVDTNWVVTTVGGSPFGYGTSDGSGSSAQFSSPCGIAVDRVGNLYVSDGFNFRIRRGFPANATPTIVTYAAVHGFSGGQFSFQIAGPAGAWVVVESSSDISGWRPVSTKLIGAGSLPITDPLAASSTARFYRARLE
jgi:streptogramin lyase